MLTTASIGNQPSVIEKRTESRWNKELPQGFLPFAEFQRDFNLESTSTELLHPFTRNLSQAMHHDVIDGLKQLVQVDEGVISGLTQFSDNIISLSAEFSRKLNNGGRIFIVGSGSSGRVGIDIAAKCQSAFPDRSEQVQGVIAGGDSAMIRAKEGFEDSEADGKRALEGLGLGENDTVILISASGSASFNVGAGHFAADSGANVLYFYNSDSIPDRTQQLFNRDRNPVIPLCIDIGPQAISGSTRLQGATLAEAGVGAMVITSLYLSIGKESLAGHYLPLLIRKIEEGIEQIRGVLDKISTLVLREHQVFSDTRSNFRQVNDLTDFGYVTFIAREECMREVLIDSTETSPTFSTNPIRRENEGKRKRAEFQAYLLGREDNHEAWKALMGRNTRPEDIKDTEAFLLSNEAEGLNSYAKRPKGAANLVIGVAKMRNAEEFPDDLIAELVDSGGTRGNAALILLCRDSLSNEQRGKLEVFGENLVLLENVPYDAIGFSETILLKQILNLISNGSMVLMNKVHGNQMIDVRASNKKLIDRCIRLVNGIWNEFHPNDELDNELLYNYIAHVSTEKKSYELRGAYTPSVVKIVLAMLAMKKTPDEFQEVVDKLSEEQERIDWI